jgi:hypothetical protein
MRSGKARIVLLVVLGALVALVATAGIGYRVWVRRCQADFDAAIAEIRARGEPVWFNELAPKDHPEWDEAGRKLDDILSRLQPMSEEFDRAFNGVGPPEPENYSALATALVENRDVIDEVVDLARKTKCRHVYDYEFENLIDLPMEHLPGIRTVAELLQVDVMLALDAGDATGAKYALWNGFKLAEPLSNEFFAVGMLTRNAIVWKALDSLKRVLGQVSMTAEEFAALDQELATLGESRLHQVVLGERAALLTILSDLGSQRHLPGNRAWLASDLARFLQIYADMAEIIDETGPQGIAKLVALETRIKAHPKRYPLTSTFSIYAKNIHRSGLMYRQRIMNARLAIRVCQFRHNHGKLPVRLDEVLDNTISAVPAGLLSDQPIRYRSTSTGFAIWDDEPSNEYEQQEFTVEFEQ